jgi:hypothetical protein
MFRSDHILRREHQGALQHIQQLADIAGPVVHQERALCFRIDRHRAPLVPSRQPA